MQYLFSSFDLATFYFTLQVLLCDWISAWWFAEWENDLLGVEPRFIFISKILISSLFLLPLFSFYITRFELVEACSGSFDNLIEPSLNSIFSSAKNWTNTNKLGTFSSISSHYLYTNIFPVINSPCRGRLLVRWLGRERIGLCGIEPNLGLQILASGLGIGPELMPIYDIRHHEILLTICKFWYFLLSNIINYVSPGTFSIILCNGTVNTRIWHHLHLNLGLVMERKFKLRLLTGDMMKIAVGCQLDINLLIRFQTLAREFMEKREGACRNT